MRKLTENDIALIIGTINNGYTIEQARVKGGKFSDSDNYGIVLGKNNIGNYVTWQFHLENEIPNYYWGHYHLENTDTAIEDFNIRK